MQTIPWYTSNVVRGVLAALLLRVVSALGWAGSITEQDVSAVLDSALQVGEFGSLLFALWSRIRQPTPPITASAAERWKSIN